MKASTGMSPWPGKLRKCRDHCSRSMSIFGASASCTKVIRSAGIARIGSVGRPRASMCQLSRISPTRGMVGAAHDLPGVAIVPDVPAPGQRLEADVDAEALGDPAQFAQVVGRPVDAAERQRRDVGADQDARGPELVHQRELAPRPLEAARALRLGHALEVAERLEGDDLEAGVAHHPADLGGRAVMRQHVGLEDLHALEARRARSRPASPTASRRARRWRSRTSSQASSSAARSVASSIGRPWKIAKACRPW